jgi:hypothetical protein
MSDVVNLYDDTYREALLNVNNLDISTDDATTAMKNLKTLSECRPPTPELEPEVIPEPTTVLGKLKAGMGGVWDNETTRVFIKASGAFAGVDRVGGGGPRAGAPVPERILG